MFTVCFLLSPQNNISRIPGHVVEVEIKGDLQGSNRVTLGEIVFSCHSAFTKQKQENAKPFSKKDKVACACSFRSQSLREKMLLVDTYLCVYGMCNHRSYEYMTLTKYVLPFIPIHVLFFIQAQTPPDWEIKTNLWLVAGLAEVKLFCYSEEAVRP